MRVKVRVKDLRKGDLAFLPYWEVLRKARVTEIGRSFLMKNGFRTIPVYYKMVSSNLLQNETLCHMDSESEYEVYIRPPK